MVMVDYDHGIDGDRLKSNNFGQNCIPHSSILFENSRISQFFSSLAQSLGIIMHYAYYLIKVHRSVSAQMYIYRR